MKFFNLKTILLLTFSLLTVGIFSSCVGARTLMMTTPKTPYGSAATPAISSKNVNAWEAQKSEIFNALEREVYGIMPKSRDVKRVSSRSIESEGFKAVVEEHELTSSYNVGEKAETEIKFNVVLVLPETPNPHLPIIMMENFCPNHNVIPLEGISKPKNNAFSCDGGGMMSNIFGYFFGRYITTPPIQMVLDEGYALAVMFPSDNFPDDTSQVDRYNDAPNKAARWGAIGAWAWQASLLSNYLDQDGRFSHTIAYGHSRYGKSALLAAAYDDTIDGVIAHQSGTGGASLSKGKAGETVPSITAQYPHWFTPAFNEENLSIDQHHLMALIAPRPILLGNAKRDVWSDPEGAFRAAKGANSIFEIYGSDGLSQDRLDTFIPSADLAFWIRPGTHGVVKEDWPAFLEFLDAHFK